MTTWYGTNLMMFTFNLACDLLGRAGFRDLRRAECGETTSAFPGIVALDNRPKESFYVEAVTWRAPQRLPGHCRCCYH